jgi:Sec-independent protein translocase protein TatA
MIRRMASLSLPQLVLVMVMALLVFGPRYRPR